MGSDMDMDMDIDISRVVDRGFVGQRVVGVGVIFPLYLVLLGRPRLEMKRAEMDGCDCC